MDYTIGTSDAPPDGIPHFAVAVTASEMRELRVHANPTTITSATELLTHRPGGKFLARTDAERFAKDLSAGPTA